jgi:NTP pyrophosphatase (non-canonical NTP hydrolase)
MLYGSLMEAYIFMKGEQDMEALYEKRFGEAIMGLKMLGEAKEVTDEYRTGPVVRPKQ